jgi:hypothetical protein
VVCDAYSGINDRGCPEGNNLRAATDPPISRCSIAVYTQPLATSDQSIFATVRTSPFDSEFLTTAFVQCPRSPYEIEILETKCSYVEDRLGQPVQKYEARVRANVPVGGGITILPGDFPDVCSTDATRNNCRVGEDCVSCADWSGTLGCGDSLAGTGSVRLEGEPMASECTIVEYYSLNRGPSPLPAGPNPVRVNHAPSLGQPAQSTMICE